MCIQHKSNHAYGFTQTFYISLKCENKNFLVLMKQNTEEFIFFFDTKWIILK